MVPLFALTFFSAANAALAGRSRAAPSATAGLFAADQLPLHTHTDLSVHASTQISSKSLFLLPRHFIHNRSKKGIPCGEHLTDHPDDIVCPAGCPFLHIEPTQICDFKCVTAEECGDDSPLTSYPDLSSMRCGVCAVPACSHCGSTKNTCVRCQASFLLSSEGKCLSIYRWYWRCLYVFLGLTVVIVFTYVGTLAWRPVVNVAALEMALAFRAWSKVHDETTGKPYSLLTTSPRKDYISGVGVMLHFNWQFIMILYAIFILGVCAVLAVMFRHRIALQTVDPLIDPFSACNQEIPEQALEFSHMETAYMIGVLVIYLASTAGSIVFAVYQRRSATKIAKAITTMNDYVLVVTGLPKMPGTQNVEQELKDFFVEELGDCGTEVIGVSCCWDYRKCALEIEEQIRWEIHEIEKLWEEENSTTRAQFQSALRDLDDAADHLTSSKRKSRLEAEGYTSRSFRQIPTPRKGLVGRQQGRISEALWSIDSLFGIAAVQDEDHELPEDRGPKEVKAMLENMRISTTAYVVCGTEKQRNQAIEYCKDNPLEFKGCTLGVRLDSTTEPETVLWHNQGTRPAQFYSNMAVGLVVLVIGVTLLDVLFYFPSVAYFLSVSDVLGMSQGGFQGTLLGLLVCICNQIIYFLIGAIADRIGFLTSDSHQRFYVMGYTAAVFFNTVIDLCVVLLLAQGYSADQAMMISVGGDSAMSTKAMAENPSMQMAIYIQYSMYIFPSCLLTPFLLEPLANACLFLLMKWLVRSRSEVTSQEAEARLCCPPFDLARYGDILINVMLCLGTLAFTYRDLWFIFIALVISLVWIYILDNYRFLRLSRRVAFVSSSLEKTVHWMTTAPCGILAACLVFRCYGQKSGMNMADEFFGDGAKAMQGIGNAVSRDTIVVVMVFFSALHIAIHCAVLHYLVPRWSALPEDSHSERGDVPYQEKAAEYACNWFTSNPVHCLRSKYCYRSSSPCIKFAAGKEHLLQPNPAQGCYYTPKAHLNADDAELWSTLQAKLLHAQADMLTARDALSDRVRSVPAGLKTARDRMVAVVSRPGSPANAASPSNAATP